MFCKDIVSSDAFMDMPTSARELYFQFGMYADDDGFVSPRGIMRNSGASVDDLNILIAKRFVLPFENGVIVIKHWKMNNYIRKDFYQETPYLEQKRLLYEKENGAYTLDIFKGSPLCQQNVNIASTQDRLGKDNINTRSNIQYLPLNTKKTIEFELFWSLYPNKKKKKESEKVWKSLSFEIMEKIISDLPLRKNGDDWIKDNGKYIPHPTTYLRGERWNDEIKKPITKSRKETFASISQEIKL